MAKRKHIAIPYLPNDNWIAGAYYITNLINALNYLPEKQKPKMGVVTVSYRDYLQLKKQTHYKYLEYRGVEMHYYYTLIDRVINKLSRIFLKKNIIEKQYPTQDYDIIFPYTNIFDSYPIATPKTKRAYWIADFQEDYLPQFFSEKEIKDRKAYQYQLSMQKENGIVFSSQDACQDFLRLYPHSQNSVFVLPFTVTHPAYQHLKIEDLKQKYDINKPYFFSPNQFWQHKNHIVILEAIKILKHQNIDFQIVFTGKEHDYRDPTYTDRLKALVAEYAIEPYVKFLGFIDRAEQLALMKHSLAVIQPSLFEGWSTVVEDAKAMNQFVILSNLKVHQEQLNDNVLFFDPQNGLDLAEKIISVWQDKPLIKQIDYHSNHLVFAQNFINLVNQTIG